MSDTQFCAEWILAQVLRRWWQEEQAGTEACVLHLIPALRALALTGVRCRGLLLPEILCRRADSRLRATRRTAVRTLGLMGSVAAEPQVLRLLTQRLEDRDGQVRARAVGSLNLLCRSGEAQKHLHSLLPRLEQMLLRDQVLVRLAVAQLLAGQEAALAAPAARKRLERLQNQNTLVRYALEAILPLGTSDAPNKKRTFGGAGKPFPPPALLPDGQARVRLAQTHILQMAKRLRDGDRARRAQAAQRLGEALRDGTRIYKTRRGLLVRTPAELARSLPATALSPGFTASGESCAGLQ